MVKYQKQANLGLSIALGFGNLEHHQYIRQTIPADTSHPQPKQLQLHPQNRPLQLLQSQLFSIVLDLGSKK